MLLAAFLVACTRDGSDATDAEPTDSETPPVETGETGATGTPTAETGETGALPPDLDALRESLQAGLDLVPRFTMLPCYAAWRAVSGDQDLACPAYLSLGNPITWEDVCTTEAGTFYGGILSTTFDQTAYVQTYLETQVMDRFGPEVISRWSGSYEGPALGGIGMDGSVNVHLRGSWDPDFTMGGQGMSVTVTEDGLTLRHHKVEGICEASFDTGGTWMDEGVDPWIHLQQLSAEGDDTYLTHVDGSVSGLPRPYTAISFEQVTMRPDGLAAPAEATCDLEPSGAIELRESAGTLYRVTFDPEVACDGCGAVTSPAGDPFGQVCADFGGLLGPLGSTTLVPEEAARASGERLQNPLSSRAGAPLSPAIVQEQSP